MRKIFINCGCHEGKSFRRFIKKNSDWQEYDIYAFEPNPKLSPKLPNGCLFYRKAIWTENEDIKLFINPNRPGSVSSSVLKNKWSGGLTDKDFFIVQAIDFSSWIDTEFNDDDYIVVKMDIEGAEYQVLEKIIKTGVIKKINALYVEFHYKVAAIDEMYHNTLVGELNAYKGLCFNYSVCKSYKREFKRRKK